MLSNIGAPGVILVIIVALIIFGPNKLPEIGRAAGRTLREFKAATKDLTSEFSEITDLKNDLTDLKKDLTTISVDSKPPQQRSAKAVEAEATDVEAPVDTPVVGEAKKSEIEEDAEARV